MVMWPTSAKDEAVSARVVRYHRLTRAKLPAIDWRLAKGHQPTGVEGAAVSRSAACNPKLRGPRTQQTKQAQRRTLGQWAPSWRPLLGG